MKILNPSYITMAGFLSIGIAGQTLNVAVAEQENLAAYHVPLMRNKEIIEQPADQRTITRRFTEEAVEKIREFNGEPFFIYLAHSMPHEQKLTKRYEFHIQ